MTWTNSEEVVNLWTGSEAPLLPNPTLDKLVLIAEAIVKKKVPNIVNNVASGKIDEVLVEMVVAGMVQRAFQKTQDGKVSFSEASGPFSHSGSYNAASVTQFLDISDSEIDLLTPAANTAKIQPVRIYASVDSRDFYAGRGDYDNDWE